MNKLYSTSPSAIQFRETNLSHPAGWSRNTIDSENKQILKREAKAINAEVHWWKSRTTITISVSAPNHFLWASNKEPSLEYECPVNQSQDAVRELLPLMAEGFIRTPKHKCDDTCECDACEEAEDEELEELNF